MAFPCSSSLLQHVVHLSLIDFATLHFEPDRISDQADSIPGSRPVKAGHLHKRSWQSHGLEVCDEQLGFWRDRSQPRWALDLFGRWSPWTCIGPNGIQLYCLLSWCSGSTSLWPLPAIHLRWDRAPRWLSSLGPIRPVTAGDTAPKELCELSRAQGGGEEGGRVSEL